MTAPGLTDDPSRDRAAFAVFVRQHYARIGRVAQRLVRNEADAQEIAQDTFLRLWNDAALIRDQTRVQAWLTRVASNLAFDRLRQRRHAVVPFPERVADFADFDRELRRAVLSREIEEAMARLPGRQRLALVLVHFEGLDQKSAAASLGISVDALESLLARSRRLLRRVLARRWRELLSELCEI